MWGNEKIPSVSAHCSDKHQGTLPPFRLNMTNLSVREDGNCFLSALHLSCNACWSREPQWLSALRTVRGGSCCTPVVLRNGHFGGKKVRQAGCEAFLSESLSTSCVTVSLPVGAGAGSCRSETGSWPLTASPRRTARWRRPISCSETPASPTRLPWRSSLTWQVATNQATFYLYCAKPGRSLCSRDIKWG